MRSFLNRVSLLGVLAAAPVWAQQAPAAPVALNGPTRLALETAMSRADAPLAGLSVWLLDSSGQTHAAQFGMQRMADGAPGLPLDADSYFRVASVSKLVSALGALRLVDAGRLDLDADISRYLGYPVRHPDYPERPISVRMLLSHTSGLRDAGGYNFAEDDDLARHLAWPNADPAMRAHWATPTPGAPAQGAAAIDLGPGRYFQYTNLNYGVLGSIIERISQQRFDVYMQEQVFRPLGIDACYSPETCSAHVAQHLAVLYRKGLDEAHWAPDGPWVAQADDWRGVAPPPRDLTRYRPGQNATLFSPQGGLRIRVADLGRLLRMLLDVGQLDGQRFLSATAVHELTRPVWRSNTRNGDTDGGLFRAWGSGAQHFTDQGGTAPGDRLLAAGGWQADGHLGFAYGLLSGFLFDRQAHCGLIYVINGTGADPLTQNGRYSALTRWEEDVLTALGPLLKNQSAFP